MSPTATTTPAPDTSATPLRMNYEVTMSPATTTSGRITVRVTSPEVPRVACDAIIIDVPIGTNEGDIFIRAPRIEITSLNWSVSSQESIDVPDQSEKVTKYYSFTIQNQAPGALVALPTFEFIITGNVNTENMHTNKALLVVQERSVVAEGKPFPKGVEFQKATYPLAKYESLLLYINSFYSTNPDSPETPKANFSTGDAINLSWESNGHSFELYQGGRKVYEGERPSYLVRTIKRDNDGHALDKEGKLITKKDEKGKDVAISYDDEAGVFNNRLVVLTKGISTDTTFVLKAISSTKAPLYETLTLTVSNPVFGPAPLTPKSAFEQISDEVLRTALEANGGDVKRALLFSSSAYIMDKLQQTSDPVLGQLLSNYLYRNGNDIRGNSFKAVLERTDGVALKRALSQTTDANLRTAIAQNADPSLKAALEPADVAKAKLAIAQNDVPTLQRLLQYSDDPKIKVALQLAAIPSSVPTLQPGDDTAYALRVSDGTAKGNMVAQALTGSNSGFAVLNFNGYFNGDSRKRLNNSKSHWRVGTDQRGDADKFFIDGSNDTTASVVSVTISAEGNVGVGTGNPTAKLHVDGAMKVTGNVGIGTDNPTEKIEVAGTLYTNSENAGFITDAGGLKRVGFMKYSGREGGIWRTNAQDFEIGRVNADALPGLPTVWNTDLYVGGNGNVGIGSTNPQGKLDVNGEIRIGGSKPIIIRRYTNIGDDATYNTGYRSDTYAAAITGMNAKGGDIQEGEATGVSIILCIMQNINGVWHIRADFKTHNKGENWDVDVMFIDRRMVDFDPAKFSY
jgi:hypothetical protein